VKKTFLPPDAPEYPEEAVDVLVSAVPENVNPPLSKVVPEIEVIVVEQHVPTVSVKIVACPKHGKENTARIIISAHSSRSETCDFFKEAEVLNILFIWWKGRYIGKETMY
jgi:hypothetical protein